MFPVYIPSGGEKVSLGKRTNEMGSTGCLLEVSSEPVEARKGPGLLRELLQRAFSLFSDVSQCASVISAPETVCLSSVFEGNSVFACQEFGVCGYVCVCVTDMCVGDLL